MKTYALNVQHSMLHAIEQALRIAQFVQKAEGGTTDRRALSGGFTIVTYGARRQIELLKLERDLKTAHRDAIANDGHGDEYQSHPIEGEELADAMSSHDEAVRSLDLEIVAAEKAIASGEAQEGEPTEL